MENINEWKSLKEKKRNLLWQTGADKCFSQNWTMTVVIGENDANI